MSLEKATAIVLRTIDWSETSSIVTLFTREFGKISGLAKGARRPKGPFESALDLLALCRIVFLRKSSDALDLLTEAKLERRFRPAQGDLSSLYAGYYVAELLGELTDEYDPHPELFDAADATLSALRTQPAVASLVLRFELTALRVLGHLPSLDACVECGAAGRADRPRAVRAGGGRRVVQRMSSGAKTSRVGQCGRLAGDGPIRRRRRGKLAKDSNRPANPRRVAGRIEPLPGEFTGASAAFAPLPGHARPLTSEDSLVSNFTGWTGKSSMRLLQGLHAVLLAMLLASATGCAIFRKEERDPDKVLAEPYKNKASRGYRLSRRGRRSGFMSALSPKRLIAGSRSPSAAARTRTSLTRRWPRAKLCSVRRNILTRRPSMRSRPTAGPIRRKKKRPCSKPASATFLATATPRPTTISACSSKSIPARSISTVSSLGGLPLAAIGNNTPTSIHSGRRHRI